MGIRTLDALTPAGRHIAVRVDINSPMTNRQLADDARLRAHADTLSELTAGDGRVAVLAHQGRPGNESFAPLESHAARLDDLLAAPVSYVDATFSQDARARIRGLNEGEVIVLENTRFYSEEYMEFPPDRASETFLVAQLSEALDVFVNDAFASSHRSHPSLVGFPQRLPSFAGRVMERELEVLGNIEATPRPRVYVLGGAKVADSLQVARDVLERDLADAVLTVGLIGNVFLFASGIDLGDASADAIQDRDVWTAVEQASNLLEQFADRIHVPRDVAINRGGRREEVAVADLPAAPDEPALDIGKETVRAFADILDPAGTVILNGPAGVYEQTGFAEGTHGVYEAATHAEYSIVGGGDTAAALRDLGIEGFDHVSTGGGATLRMLCDEPLPGIEALRTESPEARHQ